MSSAKGLLALGKALGSPATSNGGLEREKTTDEHEFMQGITKTKRKEYCRPQCDLTKLLDTVAVVKLAQTKGFLW